MPSFARRSSVLADIQEASLEDDACPKSGPVQPLRPQAQQYQLNSKKHHQYQPLCREREAEQQANGKKLYYQLNSKKHHHYQPDLKRHEPVFPKPREVKAPELADKGYNLPPVLQQKWVRDKDSGCLTKVKDITMELKKLPGNLNGLKEPEKKTQQDTSAQANVVAGGKLKIVKNKNKNGRIVIVMSKYMEAAKSKNCDPETAGGSTRGTDGSVEKHLAKMKLVKKLNLVNRFAKLPADKPALLSSGLNGDSPKTKEQTLQTEQTVTEQEKRDEVSGGEQPPEGQPVPLTSKPDPPSSNKSDSPAGLQGLKRPFCDAGGEEPGGKKRFLSCSSSSAIPLSSQSVDQNGLRSPVELQDCGYAEQEEPMDLSVVKSRPSICSATQAEVPTLPPDETQTQTGNQTEAHKPPQDGSEPVSNHKTQKDQGFPSFQPFLGNIVITDITTNCLTVTFKEYVAA